LPSMLFLLISWQQATFSLGREKTFKKQGLMDKVCLRI
jgi:hypothetical protein